jgi:periplasmic protein TonB
VRGLLFEGLDVSAGKKRKPWVAGVSVALHAAAIALVLVMPILVSNDEPVTAAPPPMPVYNPPRVRVAPPPPAPARRLAESRPAAAPATRSIEVPVTVPDRLPEPDPVSAPTDTSSVPLVIGGGCPECPPADAGAPVVGTGPGEGSGDSGGGTLTVRVGGDIEPPRKVRHVPPLYPAIAITNRIGGTVILDCVIGVDGRVTSVRVLQGHPLLNEAALQAVRQWTYTATRLNGNPVAVEMTVTVHFHPR